MKKSIKKTKGEFPEITNLVSDIFEHITDNNDIEESKKSINNKFNKLENFKRRSKPFPLDKIDIEQIKLFCDQIIKFKKGYLGEVGYLDDPEFKNKKEKFETDLYANCKTNSDAMNLYIENNMSLADMEKFKREIPEIYNENINNNGLPIDDIIKELVNGKNLYFNPYFEMRVLLLHFCFQQGYSKPVKIISDFKDRFVYFSSLGKFNNNEVYYNKALINQKKDLDKMQKALANITLNRDLFVTTNLQLLIKRDCDPTIPHEYRYITCEINQVHDRIKHFSQKIDDALRKQQIILKRGNPVIHWKEDFIMVLHDFYVKLNGKPPSINNKETNPFIVFVNAAYNSLGQNIDEFDNLHDKCKEVMAKLKKLKSIPNQTVQINAPEFFYQKL